MTNMEGLLISLAEMILAENDTDREQAKTELLKRIGDTKFGRKTAEALVIEIMADMGVSERLVGYRYAVKAILMCIEDEKLTHNIMYRLYPAVAAHFDTTAAGVERGIRGLIEATWAKSERDGLYKYFGNIIEPDKGKPTNGEFISRIANIVRMQVSV